MTTTDESWPMVEEAVFRLFDDFAASAREYTAIGAPLEELGWSDIEHEYPADAGELLFRAQGRSLAQTDCLATVMLAELAPVLGETVSGIALPTLAAGFLPASEGADISGIVLGPVNSSQPQRLAVPILGPAGAVSIAVVDSAGLCCARMDTFDPSVCWTHVSGPFSGGVVDATAEWSRAIAVAHRGLATELVALADEALRIAVSHVSVRIQFGAPIGSFQSPRHLLAESSANLEGARALLAEAWHRGDEFSALAAKAAAGRAHRAVCDAALQVCGAIGLTMEHALHRYVTRGFQIDALCGSHQQLESVLAGKLFGAHVPGSAVPAVVAFG